MNNPKRYVEMKQAIDQEHEAAMRGLISPAMIARHTFIEAHLTRGANHILELIEQQHFSEALRLMEQPSWGEDEAASSPEATLHEMIGPGDYPSSPPSVHAQDQTKMLSPSLPHIIGTKTEMHQATQKATGCGGETSF
jgi:hypothetical protein